uniref:Erythromycin biosynthesis protein CIII-like C-terminal domain-containing protein n=1 Tax=Thermosporothrix sp. COM3 TaxID=2490863 RepID=A0A455SH15_9CHLR|nr:hypothetical protein KTC_25040 [Thermosporothrix sp. COM3]
MATILFFIDEFTGHIHATFKLAHDLCQRGHTVIYLGTPKTGQQVRKQGFAFEEAPFLHSLMRISKLPRPNRAGRLPFRQQLPEAYRQYRMLREESARILHDLHSIRSITDALVSRLKPDLLIFDPFYLIDAIAFYPYHIPTTVLSTKPLLDRDPAVPPYTSSLIPHRSAFSPFLLQLVWLHCHTKFLLYRLQMWLRTILIGTSPYDLARRLAHATGFPLRQELALRGVSLDFSLKSIPELVLNSEAFDFPRKRALRQNVFYLGPCVHLEREEPAFPWDSLPPGNKLIYCSIGTLPPWRGGLEADFLRRVLDAFRLRKSYTLVLSSTIELPGPLPENVFIAPFVPQLQLLRRADLMISHGGANSVKECILLGVPMLIYPRQADQPGNAARVVYHGLGLRGNIRKESSEEIAQKVDLLLENSSYRTNLERMRQRFLQEQASLRGVEIVEAFLKEAD